MALARISNLMLYCLFSLKMDSPTSKAVPMVLFCVFQVWPGTTAFPDFFHPDATQYWTDHAKAYHDLVPYDGMWIVSGSLYHPAKHKIEQK